MTAIAERESTATPSGTPSGPAVEADTLVRGLYADHYDIVARYACRLLTDRQAGEDVAQETLIRAWRNAHILDPDSGSMRGWLLRVARNIAIDRMRARNARPTEVSEAAAATAAHTDHAEQVVTASYIRSALAELTAEHRQVLREVYLNSRTVTETADVLGVPVGTVKSRVYYALRTLRMRMREQSAG